MTTEAYDRALHAPGFSSLEQWQAALHSSGAKRQWILAHCRAIIQNYDIGELTIQIVEQVRRLDVPLHGLWAVRSSATNGDGPHASFAGVYLTRLGIPLEQVGSSVKDLWQSIWNERVLNYHATSGLSKSAPATSMWLKSSRTVSPFGSANGPSRGRLRRYG